MYCFYFFIYYYFTKFEMANAQNGQHGKIWYQNEEKRDQFYDSWTNRQLVN